MILQPKIYYNAWDSSCKSPFGAVREGETVRIRFRVQSGVRPRKVSMKLRLDGESREQEFALVPAGAQNEFTIYEGVFSVGKRGLYFYRFEISMDYGILFVGRDEEAGAVIQDFLPEWQLTVYAADFAAPEGIETGVMYQIFPDRFRRSRDAGPMGLAPGQGVPGSRSVHQDWYGRPLFKADIPDYQANDFFGGDLRGIREKLDYLKELGVTMLYLNPIFESASNHRYNTGDYKKVDPYLGTEEDFRELCAEARKRGIRVILDGVFSHTGSDSRYFNRDGHYPDLGAWQSPDSPYAPWYRFLNPERTEYDCWWGFLTLPNVNEEEPSFQEFVCGEDGVLSYWMERGTGGWRLDVADELPDGFLDRVRARIKARSPDAYLLGEVWEDASNKESYGRRRRYLLGDQLDSVMNYPWRTAVLDFVGGGDARLFRRRILTLLDHYPKPAVQGLMNPLSTHDTPRARTVLGVRRPVDPLEQGNYQPTAEELEKGGRLLRLGAMLQYTLPGFPSLYYGALRLFRPLEPPLLPLGAGGPGADRLFRTAGRAAAGASRGDVGGAFLPRQRQGPHLLPAGTSGRGRQLRRRAGAAFPAAGGGNPPGGGRRFLEGDGPLPAAGQRGDSAPAGGAGGKEPEMKKVFSVLEGIGVYLAFLLLPGILLLAVQLLAPGAAEGAYWVLQNFSTLITAAVLLAVYRLAGKRVREAAGWPAGQLSGRDCLAAFLLGICGNAAISAVLNLLPASWVESYGEQSSAVLEGPFVLILLTVVILAPLCEEIIFRGLIFRAFRREPRGFGCGAFRV